MYLCSVAQLIRVLALLPMYCNLILSHGISPLAFLNKRVQLDFHFFACVDGVVEKLHQSLNSRNGNIPIKYILGM